MYGALRCVLKYLHVNSSHRYRTRKYRCSAGNYQNAMQIRVTRIWQARGDRNLASAIARGPVAVLLYNFHGVAVEGYKAGKFYLIRASWLLAAWI